MRPLAKLLALLVAALAVLVPATSASAATTYPSISKIAPMDAGIGDTMTITGKGFRSGKGRNTVVFKRDGGRAVFVKAGRATSRKLSVVLPAKLLPALGQKSGKPVSTRFRVRVLAKRFGRAFTSSKRSPRIGPVAVGAKVSASDCDGDGVANAIDRDDDGDLLDDTTEATLKTDACKRDTDGDGMSDGWEQASAIDHNGRSLPSPNRRPYPNALNKEDAGIDTDGDGLTNAVEYAAWATYGGASLQLNYSGGDPASTGKEKVPAGLDWWDRDRNGFLSDNERDADGDGIPNQDEGGVGPLPYKLNLVGWFAGEYIEDAAVRKLIDFVPLYGALDHVHKIQPTDWLERDSDGDSVADGADDQDGDGLGNVTELVTELGVPVDKREQRPINPCAPSIDARLCIVGDADIDDDTIPNRTDTDDDGDALADTTEGQHGLNPLKADTDGDGVTDGYEFQSAIDLNSVAVPFPGKRPYPNPLDGEDARTDFDGDGLELIDEYRAWRYTGSPTPLSYSDGTLYTGGRNAQPVAADDPRDTDGNGVLSDDEKDVDGDALTNWDEAHGRMTPKWWELTFTNFVSSNNGDGIDQISESVYPNRDFLPTDFVDPDTDGDTILDGADDEDHDGFTNLFEVERPADWESTYVSTAKTGTNPRARVNPFNPCKPFYSSTCHKYPPFDYYQQDEDWASPVRADGP